MKETFLIVDGNSLMHRAYHALPLMDADGVYTNAIYGFLNMLFRVVQQENAQWLAVCFDEHGPTFRHTIYADYKAGRSETPPELRQQFDTIRTLLTDMGISWYSLLGWEADDLLGTLSKKATSEDVRALLLTGDRDALQLVGGGTELMFTRKGISETTLFDPGTVYQEFGFHPEQVTDWKGLAGDSSDHIPGVPGVGDKTAVKLLQEYGNLEEILVHAGEIKGKLGERLRENADQAKFCKELATIRRDAPVDFHLNDCRVPDVKRCTEPLKKLKLFSLIKKLNETKEKQITAEPADEEPDEPLTLPDDREPELVNTIPELERWFSATCAENRPLSFWMDDTQMTIADGSGRWTRVVLGGDLIDPGLDQHEVLSLVSSDMKDHEAIVCHIKKWMKQLDQTCGTVPEKFAWDVMLAAYLLDPQRKSYEAAALCENLPADARGLRHLAVWQKKKLTCQGMLDLMEKVEMPLAQVLYEMEKTGFRVDIDLLKQMGVNYTQRIEQLKQQVIDQCNCGSFNLNSPQQLGEILFEKLQLPHGKKTSRGYSTSAEVLENLRAIAPWIIDPLLEYRQLVKLNGTYIEGLIPLADSRDRVHSYFDQVATATGRLSSMEPNLQNIPVRTPEGKEIRKAFLPEPGWILLDADYSQIELRLMAHLSDDQGLQQAFLNGEDIHLRTASEIFDVPKEEVTPELRSRAKAVNFGIIYGISGFGLSKNTGVTQREAADFINKYLSRYPGVRNFMHEAADEGAEKGYTSTLTGRRRYLPELKSDKAQIREFGKRAAMNTPVQGTAADIIKMAMVEVHARLKANNMKSRLILQVHDELLLECPMEEIDAAKGLLKDAMENVIRLQVPLLAEVNQGANWAEAK